MFFPLCKFLVRIHMDAHLALHCGCLYRGQKFLIGNHLLAGIDWNRLHLRDFLSFTVQYELPSRIGLIDRCINRL